MRTFFTLMAIGAAAACFVIALLYFGQSSLILFPGTGGSGADVLSRCAPGSAVWTEGSKYRGKVCEPAGPSKGTIVVYHGNAGTIDDRAVLAAALTDRGFRTVLAEYPGYGRREGRATIHNVLTASLDDFAFAQTKWPGPVYVLGESFGAGIAAEVVKTYREKVAGVVLITPWDSLANVVNSKFFIPLDFLLHERFDSVNSLSAYRGNIVIVSAGQDEVLPVTHARALAKAIPAAAYLELPGAGHNDWPLFMTKENWDWTMESLVRK